MARLSGVDVSQYQGTINWPTLAKNTSFVMMRATSGDGGVLHPDTAYSRNLSGARSQGMLLGTYHYAGGWKSALTEADYYVDNTHRVDGEVQMLDFEGHILSIASPVAWAKAWLDRVYSRTHNKPMIYMSQSVVTGHNWGSVVAAGYGLVVARWGATAPTPGQWPFWAMWQNSDDGKVSGVSGPVDTDVFNGGRSQFAAYGKNEIPPVLPAPPAVSPPPVYDRYTVAYGDTLIGIAQMWHIPDWHTLYELNEKLIGGNPNMIFPGQDLLLPPGAHR